MKNIITIIIITLTANVAIAQETLPITLEKVMELCGANNLTIKEYNERQSLAAAYTSKTNEWWIPNIDIGVSTHTLDGAVMNSNGKFFLDVERDNLLLGVGLNANWNIAQGIYGRKAAKQDQKAIAYKSQVEKNKVLLSAINTYYDLVVAQSDLRSYNSIVSQADQIVEQIEIQVAAGLRYESELLLAKSNRNHLKIEMLNAKKLYTLASERLRKKLNIEQHIKLINIDTILVPLEYNAENTVDIDNAYNSRPEFKMNEYELSALQNRKKVHTIGLMMPELNIGYRSYRYGRLAENVIPVNSSITNTNNLYTNQDINASMMWKIPLGALIYNGDNRKYNSLIRLKQIEAEKCKAQINNEVASSLTQLELGKEQIKIAKESLELTTTALSQSIERQKIGTAKPFEVFQAQEFYIKAQIDYTKSISEYNKSQYALKVAMGEKL